MAFRVDIAEEAVNVILSRRLDMKVGFKIALVTVVLLASSLWAADGKKAAPKTLEAYLGLAAKNNAGLKAVFNEWKAAAEAVPLF